MMIAAAARRSIPGIVVRRLRSLQRPARPSSMTASCSADDVRPGRRDGSDRAAGTGRPPKACAAERRRAFRGCPRTWPESEARISARSFPSARPSRMRRPLAPKMSDRTPPTRSPAPSMILWTRQRVPRPPGDDLPARARDPAQLAEVLRRNHARAAETELTYAGQPYAVGDIGLAALDLFDMLRRAAAAARLRHRRRRRKPPPNRRRFLPSPQRHAVFAEPGRKIGQTARKGAELLRDAFRIRAGAGDAHGRGDLHLVNIQPGGAGMDDIELILLYHVTISCWGSCVEADRSIGGLACHSRLALSSI